MPSRPYVFPRRLWDSVGQMVSNPKWVQIVADDICGFLGLHERINVTLVNERTGGFYKSSNDREREILVVQREHQDSRHVLAVLAHELTHYCFDVRRVSGANVEEEEILTDIGTAYLGLGHLVLDGYKPVVWESRNGFFSNSYQQNSLRIGYLHPQSIRTAIVLAAYLHRWPSKQVVAGIASRWDRLVISHLLRRELKRRGRRVHAATPSSGKSRSQGMQASVVAAKAENAKRRIEALPAALRVAQALNPGSIEHSDSLRMVEIANELCLGTLALRIDSVMATVNSLDGNKKNRVRRNDLKREVRCIVDIISGWEELFAKYGCSEEDIAR